MTGATEPRRAPKLIHLNGPPGVGKSTLARRYLDDHPLALCVDIDTVRTWLGQWETMEGSKLVARNLGKTLIASHLAGGHDVILPQLLVREDAIEGFRRTADEAGATFLEVILLAREKEALARFMSRRAVLARGDVGHPENAVAPGAEADAIRFSTEWLRARAQNEKVATVDVGNVAVEDAYAAMLAIVRDDR